MQKFEYPLGIANSDNAFYRNRKIMFMAITGQSLCDKDKYYYDTKTNRFAEGREGEAQCIITLPIPNDLDDSQSHEWSDTDYLSAISGVLEGVGETASALSGGGGGGEGGGGGAPNSSFTSALGGIKISMERGLGALTDMIGTRKPMLNPGYFQNYNRSQLRSFNFNYTFIPRNKDEAQQICEIVRAFKQYSSPQKDLMCSDDPVSATDTPSEASKNLSKKIEEERSKIDKWYKKNLSKYVPDDFHPFMMSPYVWHIVIFNDLIKELSQIKTCACAQVNVKYGNGNFDTFEDGMPKVITLGLDFREMDLQFSNMYKRANIQVQSNNPTASLSISTDTQNSNNLKNNNESVSAQLAGLNKNYDMGSNADGKTSGVIDSKMFKGGETEGIQEGLLTKVKNEAKNIIDPIFNRIL